MKGHRNVATAVPLDKQQRVTRHYTILGWDNVRIESVLEMVSTKNDLMRAEGLLIAEHIGNELCLNDCVSGRFETPYQRHRRQYEAVDGVRVTCECGTSVVQVHMADHLSRDVHKKMMILKTAVHIPNEQELIRCECGKNIRRCNMAYHITTETHLLKMQFKAMPELAEKIKCPPPCETPEGGDANITYCRCQCGTVVKRAQYWFHSSTLKHKKAMLQLSAPDRVQVIQDSVSERTVINKGKVTCECGKVISLAYMAIHKQTDQHRADVAEQQREVPETVAPPSRCRNVREFNVSVA